MEAKAAILKDLSRALGAPQEMGRGPKPSQASLVRAFGRRATVAVVGYAVPVGLERFGETSSGP